MLFLLTLLLNLANATDCSLKNEPHQYSISDDSFSIMGIIKGQRVAYHDGPNCYNAALFGKGYVSELTFVDNSEFTFYINKFCNPIPQLESAGDIITVMNPDESYEHAAYAVTSKLIFEKDSFWGRNLPPNNSKIKSIKSKKDKAREIAERTDSSLYKIKSKNQSSYFGDARLKAQGAQFQVYKCQEAKNIKPDLVSLSLIPGVQEIINVNRKIENLVFSEKLDEDWQEKLATDISIAAEAAIKSSNSDNDGLFLLTKVESLAGQLHHLTGPFKRPDESSSAGFNEAFRKLEKARAILKTKQQENKSDLAKVVFKTLMDPQQPN